ncbi:adenylosuccinate lyase [Candidatus Roizmanbacteria bacterium RIFCSPHIGHO2_02_FULL_37_13b]|uniref:Adenylosuccinate lyase n=1 Tax=Candidatus Roizmanbacteria bacterium RIFCSPLOWO2_02_FULL_36_11 TaxID=1802071 RepID=A0A1F7JHM3_9BACT|nr:MAG: adenylosuccinate lyase [Candidatus Roizmanbacteria bacterium RIFCSPHIGHO2_02_FULL_37_13b]OGK55114.1 MAG: adenylosuccinate lyase [Candidatus Roizmanbacteria bacterium RIFCSPLOWO2_02_FULL_36_11]
MKTFDFKTYLSPLTWRYGSEKMRYIFSEENKYKLWRKIWVALAESEHKHGLVSKEELDDLKENENNLDINRILEIEQDTKHDVVAAIAEFAEKASKGGGKIHLGATSMDIVDNADMMRIQEAITIIENKLLNLLQIFAAQIEDNIDFTCLGYTHLQPAEPTTVGYRLSLYAQDLQTDYEILQFVKKTIKAKGFKGAVGTGASYLALLGGGRMDSSEVGEFEKEIMKSLCIDSVLISGQVYPRKFDYLVMVILASIASSIAKFAADLRILQTPAIGEWSEPFGKKQVGSSAMPFKKNPLNSEKICSLARYINSLPSVALENASLSHLERTLDDSANKRIFIPEGFLAVDEILETAIKIVQGLVINKERIKFNLKQYGPFAATESIIIEAVKAGANRQEIHELLRTISLQAWEQIQKGVQNPMDKLLTTNDILLKYLKIEKIKKLLDISNHIGDAPERAKKLVDKIKLL